MTWMSHVSLKTFFISKNNYKGDEMPGNSSESILPGTPAEDCDCSWYFHRYLGWYSASDM